MSLETDPKILLSFAVFLFRWRGSRVIAPTFLAPSPPPPPPPPIHHRQYPSERKYPVSSYRKSTGSSLFGPKGLSPALRARKPHGAGGRKKSRPRKEAGLGSWIEMKGSDGEEEAERRAGGAGEESGRGAQQGARGAHESLVRAADARILR